MAKEGFSKLALEIINRGNGGLQEKKAIDAWSLMGDALSLQFKHAEARQCYENAHEIIARQCDGSLQWEKAVVLTKLGDVLLELHKFREARACHEEAAKINPTCCQLKPNNDEQVKQKSVSSSPSSSSSSTIPSSLTSQSAEEVYEDPNSYSKRRCLERWYWYRESGDFSMALFSYSRATDRYGKDFTRDELVTTMLYTGFFVYLVGKYNDNISPISWHFASKGMEELIIREIDMPFGRANTDYMLAYRDTLMEACEWTGDGYRKKVGDEFFSRCRISLEQITKWKEQGDAFLAQDKFDRAMECYFTISIHDPDYTAMGPSMVLALRGRAIELIDKGKYKEAIVCCKWGISIDPGDAITWLCLGDALVYELGDGLTELGDDIHVNSVDCYERALIIDPLSIPALSGKCKALEKIGNRAGTLEACKKQENDVRNFFAWCNDIAANVKNPGAVVWSLNLMDFLPRLFLDQPQLIYDKLQPILPSLVCDENFMRIIINLCGAIKNGAQRECYDSLCFSLASGLVSVRKFSQALVLLNAGCENKGDVEWLKCTCYCCALGKEKLTVDNLAKLDEKVGNVFLMEAALVLNAFRPGCLSDGTVFNQLWGEMQAHAIDNEALIEKAHFLYHWCKNFSPLVVCLDFNDGPEKTDKTSIKINTGMFAASDLVATLFDSKALESFAAKASSMMVRQSCCVLPDSNFVAELRAHQGYLEYLVRNLVQRVNLDNNFSLRIGVDRLIGNAKETADLRLKIGDILLKLAHEEDPRLVMTDGRQYAEHMSRCKMLVYWGRQFFGSLVASGCSMFNANDSSRKTGGGCSSVLVASSSVLIARDFH